MTDETLEPTLRKVTFHFEARGPEGTASIFIGEYVPSTDEEGKEIKLSEWVTGNSQAYMNEAKIAVAEAIGVEYEFTAQGKVKLPPPPANVRAVQPQRQAQPQQRQPQRPPSRQQASQRRGNGDDEVAEIGVYADQPLQCDSCGGNSFYDNRGDNDERMQQGHKVSPDWKCQNCGEGVWRPGSYGYNRTAQAAPRRGNPPPRRYADEAPF